jgi:lipoprotein-releasing system ATP-binding protein
MAEPLLAIQGLTKDFGTSVPVRVLHDIDLRVARGEFAAVIGPSGSGKSTLLNIIGMLDRPTAGRIELMGQDLSTLDSAAFAAFRGQMIGFVFQFHHLLPAFTTVENVMLPMAAAARRFTPEMRVKARQLLADVGLADREDSRVTDLSGGQQQRVAIARALARDPALVLADEPTGNLDTTNADAVFRLFRQLNEDNGTAIMVITHDARLAARCDRIIEVVDGRIAADRRG